MSALAGGGKRAIWSSNATSLGSISEDTFGRLAAARAPSVQSMEKLSAASSAPVFDLPGKLRPFSQCRTA